MLSFSPLLDRASFSIKHQDHQIWLKAFYFMSNSLWTVIPGIFPISMSSEARVTN